jgi:hypothetical protein
VPDDAQVMHDERVGQPELGLQVGEQGEHLGLDRDVERRDRFVGDHQLQVERERPGDPDPLPLAAGELVRVALEHGLDGAALARARGWTLAPSVRFLARSADGPRRCRLAAVLDR